MKKMKFRHFAAATLSAVMIFGPVSVNALDVETKEGEFFAYQFSPNPNGLEHIQ